VGVEVDQSPTGQARTFGADTKECPVPSVADLRAVTCYRQGSGSWACMVAAALRGHSALGPAERLVVGFLNWHQL